MELTEALKLADEAVEQGHLMKYPQACIVLARAYKKLGKQHDKATNRLNKTRKRLHRKTELLGVASQLLQIKGENENA